MADEGADFYDQYLLSLGRLCAVWSQVDRELNGLLAAMLRSTDAQVACLATEMNDVAPRCRLAKTLSYTIEAPQSWRDDVAELCNIISNHIGPARNRFVHDSFGVDGDVIQKIDRRVKLSKPASFAELKLEYDRQETVDKDGVDATSLQALSAAARLATARFDLEYLKREGRFPESPALERSHVKGIPQLRFQRGA